MGKVISAAIDVTHYRFRGTFTRVDILVQFDGHRVGCGVKDHDGAWSERAGFVAADEKPAWTAAARL